MTRMQKYVAAVAVAAALVGTPAVSYASSEGKAAHGAAAAAAAAARKPAPTPRIVAPGEHVTAAPGFELWLTADGKHWTTPSDPEPQFRSVVDGNIDLSTPGVSLQAEITADGHAYLSGLYYGGKGTASRVEIATKAGTVQGKLIELAGRPGWGVWYATADFGSGNGADLITNVTVHDTKGKVYAQLR